MKRYAARLKTPIGTLLVENIIAENPAKALEKAYEYMHAFLENADIEINFIEDEEQ